MFGLEKKLAKIRSGKYAEGDSIISATEMGS